MKISLGERLSRLRKGSAYTQEEVAQRLGVTPQAVSKWENDLSCPDIMLLPELAKLYGVMIDDLLLEEGWSSSNDASEPQPKEQSVPPHETTQTPPTSSAVPPCGAAQPVGNYENMFLYVTVHSKHNDNVDVKVPIKVVKSLLSIGMAIPQLSVIAGIKLGQIDVAQIFALIEQGVVGELVHVVSANGDTVCVAVK